MGWFYGCKLHVLVNAQGKFIQTRLSNGHTSDIKILPKLAQGYVGNIFDDRSYISEIIKDKLGCVDICCAKKITRKYNSISKPNLLLAMPRTMLTDQHWSKLETIFRNFRIYLKQNLRNFIEAILYRILTGCPWWDLPATFGKPNSIFKKFSRWSKDNKLLKIFKLILSYADLEWVFIDVSHVRAHQHATGIKDQAISKSIGGNSSKIHLAVDSHDNPVHFLIEDGTTHDVKLAPKLVDSLDLNETEILCTDKGYDSESLREQIEKTDTQANIPKKSNTLSNNDHIDLYLYKIRHLVENAFARLKHIRGIATSYDILKQSYENAVALACIFIWYLYEM